VNRFPETVLGWLTAVCLLPSATATAATLWGGIDTTFTPGGGPNKGFDSDVFALELQPDGYILVGGGFTQNGRTSRNGIARLKPDGTLDTTGFDPGTGANDTVEALALQPDGKVVISGRFTTVNGTNHIAVARLNGNGSLDGAFHPAFVAGANNIISALALQADGKILIGGAFSPAGTGSPAYVARLNADGTVDPGFTVPFIADNIRSTPSVQSLALQADGRVLIGGQFTTVGSAGRNGIARLNANGSPDLTFDPGPGTGPGTIDRGLYRGVYSIAMQPDGKILAAGDFTNIVGATRYYVARLNTNGSLDSTFTSPLALASGLITVKVEVDGKILIGGDIEGQIFAPFNPNDMARLNVDGSYDTNFSVGTGAVFSSGGTPRVRAIVIQPDGRIVVGGGFDKFEGDSLNSIARLLGDQGGAVEFAAASYSVDENGGAATIAVRRTGITTGSSSVNYATIDNTATAGADYVAQTGAVFFGPGETNKTFTIPILPDSLVEGNETVTINLANPIGGVILGNQRTATLTIVDNITMPARPVIQTISASGGNITITWSAVAGLKYRVQFKPTLRASTWSDLPGDVTAGGTTATKTDNTVSGNERYYQIELP